jgi:hypothetical protein
LLLLFLQTIAGTLVDIRPTAMLTTEADKYLLGAAALQDLDFTADEYGVASNKTVKDVNLEALLEAKMLDEVCMFVWATCSVFCTVALCM